MSPKARAISARTLDRSCLRPAVRIGTSVFAAFGLFFAMAQYLQIAHGYSPLQAGLAGLPIGVMSMIGAPFSATFVQRVEYEVASNWKVIADNYLDGGYHVPHMHPTLAAQIDMKSYRTELFEHYSVQTSSPRSADARGPLDYDPEARIGGGAIYAWIYPTLMLNRYGPCLDSNHLVPLGPHRCKVIYEFYFAETEGEQARRFIEQSIAQAEITQREDIEICESVQIGLGSPAYDRGRYAPRVEQGEHHFHQLLARAYAAELGVTLCSASR